MAGPALVIVSLYDALIEGGTSEPKARKAAEDVANYERDMAELRRDLAVLKWMIGTVIVMVGTSIGLVGLVLRSVLP